MSVLSASWCKQPRRHFKRRGRRSALPRGRSGAARRAARWVPGEGGRFAGLVPARLIPLQGKRGLMETEQGPLGGDGDATLAATRDGRGQRLTSGGRRDDCAEHFMAQATPATFHAARSQERPPKGEVRRCPARFALGSGRRGEVRRSGSSKTRPALAACRTGFKNLAFSGVFASLGGLRVPLALGRSRHGALPVVWHGRAGVNCPYAAYPSLNMRLSSMPS